VDTHWIVESKPDPRWPYYTRGNIGEVFPEVITPLTYHLGAVPAERGYRDAFKGLGILGQNDFANDDPSIIGLFGGYCYLNLSFMRVIGVRAPGGSPKAMDLSLFGDGKAPPYAAHKGDKNIACTVKMLGTVLKALKQTTLPDVVEDSRVRTEARIAARPSLAASDEVLLRFLHGHVPAMRIVFANHCVTTITCSILSGIISDGAADAGRNDLITDLLGAYGEVASAQYSLEMWEAAKIVRATPTVAAEFDNGVPGLLERLKAMPDAGAFNAAFQTFLDKHGHRGPNDWELSSRTWENTPEMALSAIDRMRVSSDDLTPTKRLHDNDSRRNAAVALVAPSVKRMNRTNFNKAVKAIGYWARGREATRDLSMRLYLPARQTFFELARRCVDGGACIDVRDIALLDPILELPLCLQDPPAFTAVIAERVALRNRFAACTPPFFITAAGEIPSIEALEASQTGALPNAAIGTTLTGGAGSSGIARGRVRVVLDPADPRGLKPGEVLVAPHTDPSWTPLFLPAAAVVVNVGALLSHAVIVSRELGIPCAISVEGATERLADGMLVEVDGAAGTVRILEQE
jgi:rifampicin phosphotransferase